MELLSKSDCQKYFSKNHNLFEQAKIYQVKGYSSFEESHKM